MTAISRRATREEMGIELARELRGKVSIKRLVKIELPDGGELQVWLGSGADAVVGDRAKEPAIARVIKRVMKGVSVEMDPPKTELSARDAARLVARGLERGRKLSADVWNRPGKGWCVEVESAAGASLGWLQVSAGAEPITNRSKLDPEQLAAAMAMLAGVTIFDRPDPAVRAKLLAAIAKHPTDDAPRAVFADWLMEQSDPVDRARGELIVAQLAGAKGAERAHELLELHIDAWSKGFRQARNQEWSYARGMLDTVAMQVDSFNRKVAELVAVEPALRVVRIGGRCPDERMLPLAKNAAKIPHLEELDLSRLSLSAAAAKLLLSAKLPKLKHMRLGKCADSELKTKLQKKYPGAAK